MILLALRLNLVHSRWKTHNKDRISTLFLSPNRACALNHAFVVHENKSKECVFGKSRIPSYFAIQTTCLLIGLSDLWLFDMQSTEWFLCNWSWLLTEAYQEVFQARKPIKYNTACARRVRARLKWAQPDRPPVSCRHALLIIQKKIETSAVLWII